MPRSNAFSWMKEEQHRSHCALFCQFIYCTEKKFNLRKLIQNVNLIKVIKFKMYNLIKIINSKCKFNKDNEFKM